MPTAAPLGLFTIYIYADPVPIDTVGPVTFVLPGASVELVQQASAATQTMMERKTEYLIALCFTVLFFNVVSDRISIAARVRAWRAGRYFCCCPSHQSMKFY